MKHSAQPFRKTGLCHVCGRSTKLLIHQECGRKIDAAKTAKKVATVGTHEFSQKNKENANHNYTKKLYAKGCVPKFCFN
jgi:hypothetical protein